MSGIPPITPAPISPYGKLSMHARCLTCDAKASPFVSKFAEFATKGGRVGRSPTFHPCIGVQGCSPPLTHPLTEIEGGRLGGIEGGAEGGIEGGI